MRLEEKPIVVDLSSNIQVALGLELSDSRSFFSLGGPSQYVNIKSVKDNGGGKTLHIELTDGAGELAINDQSKPASITRTHAFKPTKDTLLLDLVSRYVFPKNTFTNALIAGNDISHQNENIYYQFFAKEVILEGQTAARIAIKDIDTANVMEPVMYVRDEPNRWVVHIRLLPKDESRVVVKLNYAWYNRALPKPMSNLLWSIKPLRTKLLYRGERKRKLSFLSKLLYKILPLSAYPLALIKEGNELKITSTCELQI